MVTISIKVSDAEARARAAYDLRWKVALGVDAYSRPFVQSTLQCFRAQLILHEKMREVSVRGQIADAGGRLKKGVSQDHIVSVHDPEMCYGRKSRSQRFDGHKAAVAVDPQSQLITAVAVLPGNAPDARGAWPCSNC